MRHIDQVTDTSDLNALLDSFITSTAFPHNMRYLIHALKGMTTILPGKAMDVCEHALGIARDLGDISTAHLGRVPETS